MPPKNNSDRLLTLEQLVSKLELAAELQRVQLDKLIDQSIAQDKSQALLQQRFDDSVRRADLASKWWWGLGASLIAALFAAVMALASALIVAQAPR